MKEARLGDWRRRLESNQERWRTRLTGFSFNDVPGLGTAEVSFSSPVTLITGPNGVGKSTLLKAMWATLDPTAAAAVVATDRRLIAGSSTAGLASPNGEVTAGVQYRPEGPLVTSAIEIPVVRIDSATDALRYRNDFCQFEGTEDITNGSAARELRGDDLAEISFLLKRDYRSVTLYEVEVGGEVPFFEVSYGNDQYDSRTMGAGEIAAFHIWWMLSRCQADSVVLIEEPEAFLSYGCQEALARLLISHATKKRFCTVISSHAAPLIAALPKASLRFLTRGANGLQVVGDDPPPILLRSVGINPPIKAIAFVEDAAGKAFFKAVLERSHPSLARQIAIDVRNGEGDITNALRLTMAFDVPVRFLGLYDGDVRETVPEDVRAFSFFLPGERPIEEIFRDLVRGDPATLAAKLGSRDLLPILNGLEGAECHDWFEGLAREVGLSREQLFPIIFGIWMADGRNSEAVDSTVRDLIALLAAADGSA